MIVNPDFFNHWKTVLLTDELDGDPSAPLYVLRLWAHCQNRREWRFSSMPDKALRALCRYTGDASKLASAMESAGFIERESDGVFAVCGWDEYNSQLIANWTNGKLGGRPKKPIGNPSETHRKPRVATSQKSVGEAAGGHESSVVNDAADTRAIQSKSAKNKRSKTQRKPTGNPPETDRIGVDKIRDNPPPNAKQRNVDLGQEPHPVWRDLWMTWLDTWESRWQRSFDPLKAQIELGQLLDRPPDKAKRDLEFSLQTLYCKNIKDSDDDWSKGKRSSSGGRSRKDELGI